MAPTPMTDECVKHADYVNVVLSVQQSYLNAVYTIGRPPPLLHSSSLVKEQEVEVAGMCWWGESALVVASRLKHGFILLLYSRKHLSSDALITPPIRLPVGMRPLFMQVGARCANVFCFLRSSSLLLLSLFIYFDFFI